MLNGALLYLFRNRPTGVQGAGGAPVEGGCPRCGGRVYEAERRSTAGMVCIKWRMNDDIIYCSNIMKSAVQM